MAPTRGGTGRLRRDVEMGSDVRPVPRAGRSVLQAAQCAAEHDRRPRFGIVAQAGVIGGVDAIGTGFGMRGIDMLLGVVDIGAVPAPIAVHADGRAVIAVDRHSVSRTRSCQRRLARPLTADLTMLARRLVANAKGPAVTPGLCISTERD